MTDVPAQAVPATQRGRARLALASAASLALHVALLAAIVRLPPGHSDAPVTPVSVDIVETRPTPPSLPAPATAPEPRRVAAPARPAPRDAPARPTPRAEPAPPPPNAPAAQERSPGPIRFGVSMSSTTAAGASAAPVGNSAYGTPPTRATEPSEAAPYRAGRYAPPSEVTSMPVPVRVEVPRSEYPPDALREGFEGSVRLRLVVAEDGTVREATVLSDPGRGLGAAAVRVARRWFRFRPAVKDGVAVATEIPFTVEFQIQ